MGYLFTISFKTQRRHTAAYCLSRPPFQPTPSEEGCFDDYWLLFLLISRTSTPLHKPNKAARFSPDWLMQQIRHYRLHLTLFSLPCFSKNYCVDGTLLLLVVPQILRSVILRAMHNDATSHHVGFVPKLHRIRDLFYWPDLRSHT